MPVRARHREQLHGLDFAGAGDVRTTAKVGEVALLIDRDGLVRYAVDKLKLVGLPPGPEQLNRLLPWQQLVDHRNPLLCQLSHPFFYLRQVGLGERLLHVEIVVESLGDCRADGHLGFRVELLHRLGHQVGGGVPVEVPAVFRVERHRLDLGVVVESGS